MKTEQIKIKVSQVKKGDVFKAGSKTYEAYSDSYKGYVWKVDELIPARKPL